MNDASRPIGLFDSGIGGLTVLHALRRRMPAEDLLYLGDTARLPYGTKSAETIVRYTLQSAHRLVERGVKMLVVACNTASSVALPALRERFAPLPVLGVIRPGAEAAAAASRNGVIAVLGTEATISGGAYQEAIAAIRPEARVVGRACTLFVPLAEEGWMDGPIVESVAARYLEGVFDGGPDAPDTLMLGCTHFPLLKDALARVAGPGVTIIDSAVTTAEAAARRLTADGMLHPDGTPGRSRFLTTDNLARFTRIGALFLGEAIPDGAAELVDL